MAANLEGGCGGGGGNEGMHFAQGPVHLISNHLAHLQSGRLPLQS